MQTLFVALSHLTSRAFLLLMLKLGPQSDQPYALLNCITMQVLSSGHRIILTTTDPENLPLPNERLIVLQWLLARVLRMSGAGEDNDIEYDDSPKISPVASLISSRTESPEFQAEPPELPAAGISAHATTAEFTWWYL